MKPISDGMRRKQPNSLPPSPHLIHCMISEANLIHFFIYLYFLNEISLPAQSILLLLIFPHLPPRPPLPPQSSPPNILLKAACCLFLCCSDSALIVDFNFSKSLFSGSILIASLTV